MDENVDGEGIIGEGLRSSTRIYRTVSFKRLEEILVEKRNTLVHPSIWPDTFEDLLGQSTFYNHTRLIGKLGNAHRFFGQCWTLHTASDAIWQIYSKGNDGFRIRTNVGKLVKSLKLKVDFPAVTCHIGKVKYLNDRELVDWGRRHFRSPGQSLHEATAASYMVKRKAFKHEKEVRLVYYRTRADQEDKLFSYSIEPNDLIDQIMIHPQVSVAEYKELKRELQALGFNGAIKRSLLYAPPKDFRFHL